MNNKVCENLCGIIILGIIISGVLSLITVGTSWYKEETQKDIKSQRDAVNAVLAAQQRPFNNLCRDHGYTKAWAYSETYVECTNYTAYSDIWSDPLDVVRINLSSGT